MKRIGLFGGSFNPVHLAHVALARQALTSLSLDEVRWIPTAQSGHKSGDLAAAVHREAMVRLAIDGEPRFIVDRCELQRGGASYTWDTVCELQAQFAGPAPAEWVLLIGQDQYAHLHTWQRWRDLLARVTLAVANRPGASAVINPEVLRTPHRMVALPMMDVSSTQIRERVACAESINELVPAAVARYIEQHHLYRRPVDALADESNSLSNDYCRTGLRS